MTDHYRHMCCSRKRWSNVYYDDFRSTTYIDAEDKNTASGIEIKARNPPGDEIVVRRPIRGPLITHNERNEEHDGLLGNPSHNN
jgi:hypothetical protein